MRLSQTFYVTDMDRAMCSEALEHYEADNGSFRDFEPGEVWKPGEEHWDPDFTLEFRILEWMREHGLDESEGAPPVLLLLDW